MKINEFYNEIPKNFLYKIGPLYFLSYETDLNKSWNICIKVLKLLDYCKLRKVAYL